MHVSPRLFTITSTYKKQDSSMVGKNVLAGFQNTEIYPYNPDEIPVSVLAPSTVTERSNGERTTGNFSAISFNT